MPSAQLVRRSRKFGFAAASCIHPSVVHVLNEEYGVSPEAVDRARRMIAAYDDVIARGIGAVTFEGKMIDVPVVEREKALLRQAERFAADAHPSARQAFSHDDGLRYAWPLSPIPRWKVDGTTPLTELARLESQ